MGPFNCLAKFFLSILVGLLIPLFWTLVSKPVWIRHLCAFSLACNGFLRFTSGATPAELLAVRMLAKPIADQVFSKVNLRHLCKRIADALVLGDSMNLSRNLHRMWYVMINSEV